MTDASQAREFAADARQIRTAWEACQSAVQAALGDYRRPARLGDPEQVRALVTAVHMAAQDLQGEAAGVLSRMRRRENWGWLRPGDAGQAGQRVPLLSPPGTPCPDGCEHDLTLHSADLGCWLCDCTHGRSQTGPAGDDQAARPGRYWAPLRGSGTCPDCCVQPGELHTLKCGTRDSGQPRVRAALRP